MPDSPASLNRFVLTHQGHGGQLQIVPKDGGREWLECSRCGARILAPPPEGGDVRHEDDSMERSA